MNVAEVAARHPAKALLLIAALMFAAVTWTVLVVFEQSLRQELRAGTESAHSAFTRVFVNDHWEALRPLLDLQGRQADPAGNPELQTVDRRVRGFAKGTDLVTVRILNARGAVLYSSDLTQVGQSVAGDAGFLAAARGRVSSTLVHRDVLKPLDGVAGKRSLVESYVPVRGVTGVEAVVEMHTDRTSSVLGFNRLRGELLRWMLPVLGLGFAVVLLSSAWINRILKHREALARADAQESQLMSEAASQQAEARQEVLQALVARIDGPMQRLQAQTLSIEAAHALSDLHRQTRRLALWTGLQQGVPQGSALPRTRVQDGVAAAAGLVADEAARQGVKLEVHVDDSLRERALDEADAFQEVLTLLLESALACTPAGVVQLKVLSAPAGISLDLITHTGTTGDTPEAQHLRALAEALATPLGGRLDVKFTPGRGGWIHLLMPGHGRDPQPRHRS